MGGSRNTPLTGVTQNPKTPNGSSLLTPNKMIRPNNNGVLQNDFNAGQKFATAGVTSHIPTSGFMVNTNKDVSQMLPPANSQESIGSTASSQASGGNLYQQKDGRIS